MTTARARAPHLDQILGPADDTVTFFQPRAMVYVTMLWVIAAVWVTALALHILLRFAIGNAPSGNAVVTYLEAALIVPVVLAAVILLFAWRRLGWLHSSMHGLDFAATGRKPVHLPWAGVAAVALRHRGPFTELVITPVAEDFATIGDAPAGAAIVTYLEVALIVPVVLAAVILLLAWRRLGWLHSSMHGLDFAATGRKPVHLPWAGVAAVALRHRGPFTELVVTPVAEDFATVGAAAARRPRMRRRGGEVSYLVDVGLMSPGPEVLLAELHRRLPDKV